MTKGRAGHARGRDEPHGAVAPGTGTPAQRRALRVALALNLAFVGVEVVGGFLFRSLALLADAGHTVSDVAALALALLAFRLAGRPRSARHTYGLQRFELLAALLNGVVLVLVAAWIAVEAVERLASPVEVEGGGLLAVALAGLGVNVAAAVVLRRAGDGNVNMHAAFLHLAADAAATVGALVAAVAVLVADATWVDPAVSLVIAALITWSVWRLLRHVVHLLLEGAPPGLGPERIAAVLHTEPEVDRIHHIHVWSISSDSVALSAHVVAERVQTLHDAQLLGDRLKQRLAHELGIDHATIELECHDCRGQQLIDPAHMQARHGERT